MDVADYLAQDATGLAELVADRQVSARELLDAARARADAVDPRLNAIVRRMDAEADARVAEPLEGPLAGVPFLLKDLYQDHAGVPTSNGSKAWVEHVPDEHATVVARWLDAGLVVLGKTNTPEFGAKAVTEPALWGACRNPWDLDRTPGGSSGGSAAAVAAGIVPMASASDGGGSIRIPASCCGLVGLKPGRGLVPSGPRVGEGMSGSSVNGVLARTVRDAALGLQVLVGPEAVSGYLPALPERPLVEEVGENPGRLRVALCTASAITPSPDPEAVAAAEAAGRLLEAASHHVEPLDAQPVDDRRLAEDFLTTWFVSCARSVAETKRVTGAGDEGFEADTLLMATLGRATGALEHLTALEARFEHTARLAAFHERFDLLLTPATARPAPRIGALDQPALLRAAGELLRRVPGAGLVRHTPVFDGVVQRNLGWVPYTQLANLTGRPAVSLPVHTTADGVPLGAQLVGRLGSEGLLLRVAAQLEEAVGWGARRPSL